MTGHRIGILQLQRIVILILTHSLISLLLGSDMGIIFIDSLIQRIRLLISKGGTLGLQCIQNYLCNNLLIVIIREGDARLSEMKPVPLLKPGYLLKLGYVTVCDIVHSLDAFEKLIAVLYNHQLVIAHKPLLLELYGRTYAQVVFDGPPVGTAQDHSLIFAICGIGI